MFEEIADIMGLDSADSKTTGWFAHRTTASRNILNRMSNAEKNKLNQQAEKMGEEGLPEELKRK